MFLTDDRNILRKLTWKANDGARVRLLFGDPASAAIARRSTEGNIGKSTVSAKIRRTLAFFKPVSGVDGIEIRCHGTALYNSIYRYDDDMIVNPHVYGFQAPHASALHLRRLSGEVRQEFSLCFRARPVGGTPRTSSESKEVHWSAPADIAALDIGQANRLRIEHGLQQRAEPYIG